MKKMTTFVISKDVVKPTEEIIELIGQFRSEIPTLESEENLPFIILQDGARASEKVKLSVFSPVLSPIWCSPQNVR